LQGVGVRNVLPHGVTPRRGQTLALLVEHEIGAKRHSAWAIKNAR
jgi:hypothetical protein